MNTTVFKTIGIGVTFSPNLEANINEAARLALFFGSKLILIHVGKSSEDKLTAFSSLLSSFKDQGLVFEVTFNSGDPVEVILSTTEQKKIDLLIIGALKKEKFLKYYVGSIARKITRKANCSILLLINPSKDRVCCNHIVVNGLKDPKTEETLATAFLVGNKLGASKITVVEEISDDEVSVKVDDDKSLRRSTIIKERLRVREEMRVKAILKTIPNKLTKDIKIKSQPIFGKRGYSIGHYAQVARADLLVMNAPRKMNFWDRLFPHDIEHILTELPTDVLIVQ
ncbi:MAG: universal stress protein [Formosa sp.]|nr:universal stress protein [Formosa sp.]MDB2426375.1 universal stress protein [Flavobacteriaceae bacterium]MDC0463016.1 universal stress protein [Flavobacteriaceae bacterium]MDC3198497.1 universal stress protein [Flavobacteriaceae bacterium]MDC3350394.1 universal stress protein [Flavobacteriaceae bacterium]